MTAQRLLAIDIGAESGRGVVGAFDGRHLQVDEVRRFANVPVHEGETLYWDFPKLLAEVEQTIQAAGPVASVGVDTWGVDFGLLDDQGRLLNNPVHYRDKRTSGILQQIPREKTYEQTGIQFLEINTLPQLLAMPREELAHAHKLLLIPDLIHHFLCGSSVSEYTNATTTQCFNPRTGSWAYELLDELHIPTTLFPHVVPPGTVVGERGDMQVVAPATHDTASAVAAMPLDAQTAFLSSGTWSLIGLELDKPVITDAALAANLTNEGGVAGTTRLLKNVMGLWLLQQARAALGRDYAQLTAMALSVSAATAYIDPDDPRFLRTGPDDLVPAIDAFCRETNQAPPPHEDAMLVRVLLESLALKYAFVLRQLEKVTARRVASVYVVGGGVNNVFLSQLTSDATGLPVVTGPAEATALGNLAVQAIALGELASIAEARSLVAETVPVRRYAPRGDSAAARDRFEKILAPEVLKL